MAFTKVVKASKTSSLTTMARSRISKGRFTKKQRFQTTSVRRPGSFANLRKSYGRKNNVIKGKTERLGCSFINLTKSDIPKATFTTNMGCPQRNESLDTSLDYELSWKKVQLPPITPLDTDDDFGTMPFAKRFIPHPVLHIDIPSNINQNALWLGLVNGKESPSPFLPIDSEVIISDPDMNWFIHSQCLSDDEGLESTETDANSYGALEMTRTDNHFAASPCKSNTAGGREFQDEAMVSVDTTPSSSDPSEISVCFGDGETFEITSPISPIHFSGYDVPSVYRDFSSSASAINNNKEKTKGKILFSPQSSANFKGRGSVHSVLSRSESKEKSLFLENMKSVKQPEKLEYVKKYLTSVGSSASVDVPLPPQEPPRPVDMFMDVDGVVLPW